MLYNVEKIQLWERQLLLVLKQAADNSPQLDCTQKERIEDRLQQVVDIWTEGAE